MLPNIESDNCRKRPCDFNQDQSLDSRTFKHGVVSPV